MKGNWNTENLPIEVRSLITEGINHGCLPLSPRDESQGCYMLFVIAYLHAYVKDLAYSNVSR